MRILLSKAAEVGFPINKATVSNLSEGKEYEFRVVAINKGGPSEPSETSRPQIAKPRFGKIDLKKKSVKEI
jgi:hypothetical protein